MNELHPSGIDPDVLIGLTLQRYDGVAIALDLDARAVRFYQLWGRGRGSRYCPACLMDSGGRWQLAWRLSWSFCCPRHGLLLVDRCPHCGRVPRAKRQRLTRTPVPGRCSSAPASTGRVTLSRARVCGYELATSDAIAVPAGGPLVRAQLFVNQLLTRPASQAEPVDVVYGAAMPPAEVIADLKALGAGMLAVSDEIDLKEVPHPIVARWQAGAARTTARERRTGFAAPPDAASTAIAVSSAVQVLMAPDIDAAAHQIGWLLDRARDRGVAVGPTVMANYWGTTSHGLQRVILRALDTRLRPTDRLRYSTATRQPRFPEHLPKGSSRRLSRGPWDLRWGPPRSV